MSGFDDGYAYLVSQNTELKVELANAVSSLKRAHEDNRSLNRSLLDLQALYEDLQTQHNRLQYELVREKEERHQLDEDHERQRVLWRTEMEDRARHLEEEFQRQSPPQLETVQWMLEEECHDRYKRRIEDLEAQCASEAHRAADACRKMELERLRLDDNQNEARDQLEEERQRHAIREQALKRQVATLEGELKKQMEKGPEASWSNVHELETKVLGLQRELQEQERHSEKERKLSAEKLVARDQELNAIRRRLQDLHIEFEAQERANEQLTSDVDNLKREHTRLTAQLTEARHKNATMKPAEESEQLRDELAHIKSSLTTEREQLAHRLKVAEERLAPLQAAVWQAEAKARQLEDERDERERDVQHEREESERGHAAEVSNLRIEAERSKHDAEERSLAWRKEEASLNRRYEEQKSRAESFADDLAQSQLAQRETEKRLRDLRSEFQQRETAALAEAQKHMNALQTELASLRERETNLVRECAQISGDLETTRTALRKQQQRTDALHAEVQTLSQRLDIERGQWVREADEAQTAAIRVEEERRNAVVLQLTEDHKQRLAKLHAASKRALQKAARKRQDLRQKCQELARRIGQVSQEKAMAIRICEENKAAYELRLTEFGMVSRLAVGMGTDVHIGGAPAVLRTDVGSKAFGCMNARELQAMRERLAQNAETVKASVPGTSS